MKEKINTPSWLQPVKMLLVFLLANALLACGQQQYTSPNGYHLNAPEKFIMPQILREISGIAFSKGNSSLVYAEQDEEGKLFYFHLGDKNIDVVKFGKKGDYEDVAICNNMVIMLRSDGVLFSFPLTETKNAKTDAVTELQNLLPTGEYEGMWADETTNTLYILCKHCSDDKTSKTTSGYMFQIGSDGKLVSKGGFAINVKEIEALLNVKKIEFHPSAIAKNAQTNQWFILSSVNKLLVVVDNNWQVKNVFALDPAIFNQPEGIAFDNQNNLYISNEGEPNGNGNILKFSYQKN